MLKILVIDDSTTVRQYVRLILENIGYEVIEAANGKEGYSLYKNHAPHLIITDILMPEMDGLELILKLKLECPRINIIVISDGGSYSEIPYFTICKNYGIKHCIKKPITKNALLEAIDNFQLELAP